MARTESGGRVPLYLSSLSAGLAKSSRARVSTFRDARVVDAGRYSVRVSVQCMCVRVRMRASEGLVYDF